MPADVSSRFQTYCRHKEAAAVEACLPGFATVAVLPPRDTQAIGNEWTRRLFDGDFYVAPGVSLVFVQSADGNTGADDPSSLGGGETDKHLIYEGLSRVAADAVLAGATTVRDGNIVLSVWHPRLVELRRELGLPRHPAQVVVTDSGNLPLESGLTFATPEVPVWMIAPSRVAAALRERARGRDWVTVIDAGQPASLTAAMLQLHAAGVRTISAIGGRRTATALLREGLVRDLYLTTSPRPGGEPNTPFHEGPPLALERVVEKVGKGEERGVRFEHFRLRTVYSNTRSAERK